MISNIRVLETNIILRVDVRLEYARARHASGLLNKHGVPYRHDPFDYSRYEAVSQDFRCYDAAIAAADKYGLTYVEGILIYQTEIGVFPLSHGWCVDGKGRVVDPTCAKHQGLVKCLYYGVPVKRNYAHEWKERTGYYGCLDGDKEGNPIGVHHESAERWLDK